MSRAILDFYRQYSMFTYPGLYEPYLQSLPDEIRDIGFLVRKQLIHRTTLDAGNVGSNADLKYGDMTKIPWYRQAEDDYLVTAVAIIAELFRRDKKGFYLERSAENKVVLTCRHTTILIAAILKSKGIPVRVRAGFAPYWPGAKVSSDHWVNQYWNEKENRWVTVDVDGSLHKTGFDMYDFPDGKFDFSADAWLAVRKGKIDGKHFHNAGGFSGPITIAWQIFYDFHCLVNNEIIYLHHPRFAMLDTFPRLTEEKLVEIDNLAMLMQNPDDNFSKLQKIWETNKEYRLLSGALL